MLLGDADKNLILLKTLVEVEGEELQNLWSNTYEKRWCMLNSKITTIDYINNFPAIKKADGFKLVSTFSIYEIKIILITHFFLNKIIADAEKKYKKLEFSIDKYFINYLIANTPKSPRVKEIINLINSEEQGNSMLFLISFIFIYT